LIPVSHILFNYVRYLSYFAFCKFFLFFRIFFLTRDLVSIY